MYTSSKVSAILIEDGHVSHITIDVIELVRANNIHLLCLPSHTLHNLQPLAIGNLLVATDIIAALAADAWHAWLHSSHL